MLASFRQHSLRAAEAAQQLGLSTSRFYTLFSDYLRACARKTQQLWIPRSSGGDHTTTWPEPVTDLLKKRLACSPPCPYSFAASDVWRLLAFRLDRAQVRRWAIENGYAHATPPKRPPAPVRRWQRSQIGELWQLDASPHRWFPRSLLDFPMLNMLDDCSRVFVGSKLYGRELLLSYLDFLPAAFLIYGRPLQIYVDYHAIFFTKNPDALTQLGWALKFYDISFLYAPTPQAKGKIEREQPMVYLWLTYGLPMAYLWATYGLEAFWHVPAFPIPLARPASHSPPSSLLLDASVPENVTTLFPRRLTLRPNQVRACPPLPTRGPTSQMDPPTTAAAGSWVPQLPTPPANGLGRTPGSVSQERAPRNVGRWRGSQRCRTPAGICRTARADR